MRRNLVIVVVWVLIAAFAAACSDTPEPTPSAQSPEQSETARATQTSTPIIAAPSPTKEPDNAPEPQNASLERTNTPIPTPSDEPESAPESETPTPEPTASPVPTSTAQPSQAVEQPTATPTASATPTPVPSINISQNETTMAEGTSLQLSVTTNITNAAITWSSSNSNIARVNSSGVVEARSVGTVTINATSRNASDSTRVTVTHGPVASVQIGAGSGRNLTAILRDGSGHVLNNREVTWSSSNPEIVDVDEQTGALTVRQTGRVTIVANSEGASDQVSINVGSRQEVVASIEIAPGGFALDIGDQILMAVELKSADGELLTEREVSWFSDNSDVVSVDERGLIAAKAPGEASITATSEGVSVTETFTVRNPQVDYQLLFSSSPNRTNPQPLSGAATFGDMHIFTSPDEGVATVTFFVNDPGGESSPIKTESAAPYDMLGTSADGTAQTLDASQVEPNSYTITADILQTDGNAVSISATFSVLPVPVDTLAIAPTAATVEEGQTIQLETTAFDSEGNILNNREVIWSSGNQSIAEVNANGVVTGVSEGATTISAQIGAVLTNIPMSVTSSQVNFFLKVSTNLESLEEAADPSNHQPLNGASIYHTNLVMFTEPQESIQSVRYNMNGVDYGVFGQSGPIPGLGASFITGIYAVGLGLGSHSLVANVTSVDGETQTIAAVFNFIKPPVESVEIVVEPLFSDINSPDLNDVMAYPEPESIPVGFGTTLYALVHDVLGNLVSDREITWSSSNKSIISFLGDDEEEDGNVFYLRQDAHGGNNGSGSELDNLFSINNALPQEAQIVGESVGPVTLTATVEGVSSSLDMNVHMPFESTNVSTNGLHTCALTFDGDAYCWGLGEDGQLGDPTNTPSIQPAPELVSIGRRFSDISANAFSIALKFHTCGVAGSERAMCWGEGESGQLGNGLVNNGPSFSSIENSLNQITAGGTHTCGLNSIAFPSFQLGGQPDSDVTNAFCWGNNLDGQLGDGSGQTSLEPESVAGGIQFKTLSAGGDHTCGTTAFDEGYCWGENSSGQLGIGSITADQLQPRLISNEIGFESISAGLTHSCGLHGSIDTPGTDFIDATNGSVYCWGDNEFGQLGIGSTEPQVSPVEVAGGLLFLDVAAGPNHTCGVTPDDEIYCWGDNEFGQLGIGTNSDSLIPTLVPDGRLYSDVFVGHSVTCALSSVRQLFCWGSGSFGALGTGQEGGTYVELAPVPVSNIRQFVHVSTGTASACALNSGGKAYCWGVGDDGQLGNRSEDDQPKPVPVVGSLTFQSLDNGGSHVCGITTRGIAYCWGLNQNGQVGDGTELNRFNPVQVQGGLRFNSLSAGQFHTCGIDGQRRAHCWGYGEDGQLGNGSGGVDYEELAPVPVSTRLRFTSISAGGMHTCGLTAQGEAYCWGNGNSGQLGNSPFGVFDFFDLYNILDDTIESDDSSGNLESDPPAQQYPNAVPQLVMGDFVFAEISAGFTHTCGITTDGKAYCWGEGDNGKLGIDSTVDRATPVLVTDELRFKSISAGISHTCALTEDNELYCWGSGSEFRIGLPQDLSEPEADHLTPVRIGHPFRRFDYKSISGYGAFTCGISTRSTALCWGQGTQGQLGDGLGETSEIPVTVRVPK